MAPPPFVRAVSFGPYEYRMRGAIHAFKYDRMRPVARELGRRLGMAMAQLAGEAPEEMLVVPVPLHGSKLRQRGFNQARILATVALGSLRQTHPQWRLRLASSTLIRQRSTASQAGLNGHERRRNVRGAFVVSEAEAVGMKQVLLVDDILTTGATVRAAAEALLKAGAASVWVATLARAQARFAAGRERFGDWDDVGAGSDSLRQISGYEQTRYQSTGSDGARVYSSHDQPSF
jgi:ComF family protein